MDHNGEQGVACCDKTRYMKYSDQLTLSSSAHNLDGFFPHPLLTPAEDRTPIVLYDFTAILFDISIHKSVRSQSQCPIMEIDDREKAHPGRACDWLWSVNAREGILYVNYVAWKEGAYLSLVPQPTINNTGPWTFFYTSFYDCRYEANIICIGDEKTTHLRNKKKSHGRKRFLWSSADKVLYVR